VDNSLAQLETDGGKLAVVGYFSLALILLTIGFCGFIVLFQMAIAHVEHLRI